MQNEKASSRRSVNPSLHGHTHYFPFSALHFICSHSERASVRKEPFSNIVTPTIPGTLIFSRKDQEYGAGGTGVPR